MHVLITGGAGMLGGKLAAALAVRGRLRGVPITRLSLADKVAPAPMDAPFPTVAVSLDVRDRAAVAATMAERPDVVFHLAAVPSGGAEADFDVGLDVNLFGTHAVLEAARALGAAPRLVFASTLAVYGGEVPEMIEDHTALNPQTSYGAAKAAAEMLVTDYARRGFVDGVGLRLPTITIRPGAPNKAASSFMSSIFREPLQGREAVCPVSPDYVHWYQSPRRCVENLIHGAEVESAAIGANRCFVLPGLSLTIAEMVDAMRRIAGDAPVDLIRWEPLPEIQTILDGWRGRFNPAKALRLGFVADADFEDIIRFFIEDDLPAGAAGPV